MPGEVQTQSPKTRPVTRRTSIRQSLNLASVSKAFADVINKSDKDNSKDANKPSKKTKDSRRLSVQPKPSCPRTSMGDSRSPSQATIRTATPESKDSTRRRVPTRPPSDELPQPKSESGNNTPRPGILTRAASLRAKNQNIIASSLPKYRPKTATSEQLKPPSPVTVRAGTRRRLSSSDESEKEERQKAATPLVSSVDKVTRPISPLPQRAALKALNTSSTPPPPTPTKVPTPTSVARSSPTRPAKTHKGASSVSVVPRPSSSSAGPGSQSSSCSSSISPHTPQTPVVKPIHRRNATQDKNNQSLPSTGYYPESPSPPTRHVRSRSRVDGQSVGNMSHISERADEDEDELADVELLLAPVANPSAPTPAMPRIQKSRSRKSQAPLPRTPSRGSVQQLPSRANVSYLSPLSLGDGGGASHLRPPQEGSNARNAGRGSILSWEQLASEAAKTLGGDELNNMLNDIPAPFRSGAASPALSALDLPSSPCLSALDSPTGYGSISQVLLPDVTPSPAVHASQRYNFSNSDSGQVESPVVNLLRLQLAQAEHMAKERLMQMQTMEQEIYLLKESYARQMQDSARHIAYLEAKEQKGEDTRAYASSLEDRLRCAEALREQAVKDAQRKSEECARRSLDIERKERVTVQIGCAANLALSEWASVRDLAEVELDLVRGDRAVLSVLLTELDQMARAFCT